MKNDLDTDQIKIIISLGIIASYLSVWQLVSTFGLKNNILYSKLFAVIGAVAIFPLVLYILYTGAKYKESDSNFFWWVYIEDQKRNLLFDKAIDLFGTCGYAFLALLILGSIYNKFGKSILTTLAFIFLFILIPIVANLLKVKIRKSIKRKKTE